MKIRSILTSAVALLTTAVAGMAQPQYPPTVYIPVVFYDFHANGTNPDFESTAMSPGFPGMLATGMVQSTLDSDRKPALAAAKLYNAHLNQWFRPSGAPGAAFTIDALTGRCSWSTLVNYQGRPGEWTGPSFAATDSMANVVIYDSLLFTIVPGSNGIYQYTNPSFFPLDGRGFGPEPAGMPHNYSFSMELHHQFYYQPGMTFNFEGDDDTWAFVDGKLVIDLGGIHGPTRGSVSLDALGLISGKAYMLDFFCAERHITGSDVLITTNILTPYTGDTVRIVPIASPTTNRRPTFSWHKSASAAGYTLQVDTAASFISPLIAIPSSDTSYTPQADLPLATIYWRVRASDSYFGPTASFVITDAPAPTLVAYPSPTYERKPTLFWRRAVGTALTYTVQASASRTFDPLSVNAAVSDTSYACQAPLALGKVFWRVKAGGSAWSAVDSIVILDGRVPVLVAQADPTYDRRPTLRWHKPRVAPAQYAVQVSSLPDFATAIVTSATADTFLSCQSDLPPGKIYWRVRGDDSEYSIPDTFEVLDAGTPALVAYLPKVTRERRPTLRWRAVSGASSYTLAVDDSRGFSSPIASFPVADTSTRPTADLPFGKIYWRVKSDIGSRWSALDSFTVQVDSIPFLVVFDGQECKQRRPEFRWYGVQGATSYRLELADNAGFSNAFSVPVTDTAFFPMSDLSTGVWYWRVSSSRNFALFSPADSVTVATGAAARPGRWVAPQPAVSVVQGARDLRILVTRPGARVSVRVLSVSGTTVWQSRFSGPGAATWDYSPANGCRVSGGTYLLVVEGVGEVLRRAIAVLR